MGRKIINKVGQKFNKLTFIQFSRRENGETYWLIECDCSPGKYFEALGRVIVNGAKKSCGCIKKGYELEDLTGKKFNRLTVLSISKNQWKNGDVKWLCRCDCGKEKEISRANLLNESTKSCGCLQRENAMESVKLLHLRFKGKNSPHYKRDISRKEMEINGHRDKAVGHRAFKSEVLARDKDCQVCGILFDSLNKPIVHHIKIWSEWPNLRLNPKNAICLCKICHDEFHWFHEDDFTIDKQDFVEFKRELLE